MPAHVDDAVYSYPLDDAAFAAIQVVVFVQHLALVLGPSGAPSPYLDIGVTSAVALVLLLPTVTTAPRARVPAKDGRIRP